MYVAGTHIIIVLCARVLFLALMCTSVYLIMWPSSPLNKIDELNNQRKAKSEQNRINPSERRKDAHSSRGAQKSIHSRLAMIVPFMRLAQSLLVAIVKS